MRPPAVDKRSLGLFIAIDKLSQSIVASDDDCCWGIAKRAIPNLEVIECFRSSNYKVILNDQILQMQKDLPIRFFNDTFNKLLKFAKLTEDRAGQSRNLYSLRHTYAIQALLGSTDIHTLTKQMGTSVRMLELHYSKLTATMAAERLA